MYISYQTNIRKYFILRREIYNLKVISITSLEENKDTAFIFERSQRIANACTILYSRILACHAGGPGSILG